MIKMSTREAYGKALEQYAENQKIVVLDADLSSCTKTNNFAQVCPERFFNCGIAEANMVGVAAGLATSGHIPFANSFAMFIAGRCFEQIRNSVAYPHLNVKLVGTHAGLSVGEDGATHQCLEDIGIMRTLPGMTILCPCDAYETSLAVRAAVEHKGPVYLRLGRKAVETITDKIPGYTFALGKASVLAHGMDVTLVATGAMVHLVLEAAAQLSREGIHARVLDMHTIKPLDEGALLEAARETGAIVTAEEHNICGGMGETVARVLAEKEPIPIASVAVEDCFGHSGTPEELFLHYGLTVSNIVTKVKRVLHSKKCNRDRTNSPQKVATKA